MKTVLTTEEEALLERFRQKIAKAGFGITVVDDWMTLRSGDDSVTFKVQAFGMGVMHPEECMVCGGVVQLQDAAVTVVQSNGDPIKWTDKTCTYCRVPK